MKTGFVYTIYNEKNFRRYVDKTDDLNKAIKLHFDLLKGADHYCHRLQSDYLLYGEEYFKISYKAIKYEKDKELEELKQEEIKRFRSNILGYNGETFKNFTFQQGCLIFAVAKKVEDLTNCAYFFHQLFKIKVEEAEVAMKDFCYDFDVYDKKLCDLYCKQIATIKTSPLNEPRYKHLSTEEAMEVLAIGTRTKEYNEILLGLFQLNAEQYKKIIFGKTYAQAYEKFRQLTDEEKDKLYEKVMAKYEINELLYNRTTKITKQIKKYILDNQKRYSIYQLALLTNISCANVDKIIKEAAVDKKQD